MDAPITEHRFRVRTDGQDRVLTVARPHTRVVSSEYYFTYTRTATVSVRAAVVGEEIPDAADRFVPQAYAPELIKMARVDFGGASSVDPAAMERLCAMIAANSTQFPLLVLDELGSEKPLETLIDALRPLTERDIVEGPNVWIDIRGRVEPGVVVAQNAACLAQGLRREVLQPSLQRLFNGFATRRAGGIRGTLVFALEGSLYLDDLGERARLGSWRDESAQELLARQSPDCGCGDAGGDCGGLRYFCVRSAPGCAYLKSVVSAMAL